MSYLTINGYALPVADGSVRGETEIIGQDERAFSGALLSDIRSYKRSWRVVTTPRLYAEAEAIHALLLGRGHAWDFEEAGGTNWGYSSKGRTFTSQSGASRVTADPHFGSANLELSAGSSSVEWALDLPSTWTAMVWRDTGSGWAHYIETSDGDYYLDGVASIQEGWFSVSGGDFTLQHSGLSAVGFDDLVVLPFVITAEMAAAFGTSTEAFSALPELSLSGDVVGGDVISVIGRDLKTRDIQVALGGSWRNNAREVDVLLLEERTESTAVAPAPDPFVNAYSVLFDGTDEYMNLGDFATLDGATSVTWSFWIKFDAGASGTDAIWEKTGATVEQFAIRYNATTDNIQVLIFNSALGTNYSRISNSNDFAPGVWHHVAVTWSAASGINIYRNGSVVSMAAASGTNPASIASGGTAASCIASSNTSPANLCPCNVDEPALWAGLEASSAQVSEIYNAGSPSDLDDLSFASPDHWWRMGDDDTHPTIADHGSTGGFDGTLVNTEAGDIELDVP